MLSVCFCIVLQSKCICKPFNAKLFYLNVKQVQEKTLKSTKIYFDSMQLMLKRKKSGAL